MKHQTTPQATEAQSHELPAPPAEIIVPTSKLLHKLSVLSKGGKEKTTITIRLDDDCKNGHEHFSISADVWEHYGRRWQESMGGCCHEHILAIRPEFAQFVALHLSDQDGVPMHAFSNAWYWFQGAFPESADLSGNLGACHGGTGSRGKNPAECLAIFTDHTRATAAQVEEIRKACPRSRDELQFELERLGFPVLWKAQAMAAIAELERLTGGKFESKATRPTWEPLTADKVADIEQKKATGFYDSAQVATRDKERNEAAKAKKLAEIEKDLAGKISKAENQAKVERFLVVHDLKKNIIFYDHTNSLCVNWSSTDALYTKAEFDALTQLATNHPDLPPGLSFEWRARPKY